MLARVFPPGLEAEPERDVLMGDDPVAIRELLAALNAAGTDELVISWHDAEVGVRDVLDRWECLPRHSLMGRPQALSAPRRRVGRYGATRGLEYCCQVHPPAEVGRGSATRLLVEPVGSKVELDQAGVGEPTLLAWLSERR